MVAPRLVASALGMLPAFVAVSGLLLSCSSTPLHSKGETVRSLRALYGNPLVGKSLAWDSSGNEETASVSAAQRWFVSNRLALGIGLTGTRFDQTEKNVYGAEVQGLMRWHFTEWKATGFFWDLDGGYLRTTDKVPSMSTPWNYTFDFGPGFEVPLSGTLRLQTGIQYHHLSNALGPDNSKNESQNEARFWVGIGWTP